MDALRQTYRYIESYHARLGIMPTYADIAREMYISKSTVYLQMRRMRKLGWVVTGGPGTKSSIVLKGLPGVGGE